MMKTKRKAILGIAMGSIALLFVLILAPDKAMTPTAVVEPQTTEPEVTAASVVAKSEPPTSQTSTPTPSTISADVTDVPETEPTVTEVTLAATEVPSTRAVATSTECEVRTSPPPVERNMPKDAQGVDEFGNIYRIEGKQKYVWDSVLGWGEDNGPGEVTIMDVVSDGHKFHTDSNGTVYLDKVLTPSGEVISWEEYNAWKDSQ